MKLADVAAHFKISRTTVSVCLGGHEGKYGIRRELAEAVREYAHARGYAPNQAARRLRGVLGEPPVGIVFTYESGLTRIMSSLRGIVDYLTKAGREYIFMGLKNHHIGETLTVLRSMEVRDVVILGAIHETYPDEPDTELTRRARADWLVTANLLGEGMRLYAADYVFPKPSGDTKKNFTRIGFNTENMARDILARIKKDGLGPVVFGHWFRHEERLIPALLDGPEMILTMNYSANPFAEGLRLAAEILRLRRRRPVRTAFIGNDYVAAALVNGLLDAGVRVPEEIGVIGFGNYDAAPYFKRALTTIGPADGDLSLELIKSICGDRPSFPRNTVRDYLLFERESFKFNHANENMQGGNLR